MTYPKKKWSPIDFWQDALHLCFVPLCGFILLVCVSCEKQRQEPQEPFLEYLIPPKVIAGSGIPQVPVTLLFTEDSRRLMAAFTPGEVKAFDLEDNEVIRIAAGKLPSRSKAFLFLDDGKRAVIGGYGNPRNDLLELWDLDQGKRIREFLGHSSPILALALSPDGTKFLSGGGGWAIPSKEQKIDYGEDYSIRLWEIDTGEEISTLLGHDGMINCLDFSPAGSLCVSSSRGKMDLEAGKDSGETSIRIWDLKNAKQIHHIDVESNTITDVEFSPDGNFVLGSYSKEEMMWGFGLWDTMSGEELWSHEVYGVTLAGFSPNGRSIFWIEDGGIIFSDYTGQERIATLPFDTKRCKWFGSDPPSKEKQEAMAKDGITGPSLVAFSPDGRRMAIGEVTGSVSVWNLAGAGL